MGDETSHLSEHKSDELTAYFACQLPRGRSYFPCTLPPSPAWQPINNPLFMCVVAPARVYAKFMLLS